MSKRVGVTSSSEGSALLLEWHLFANFIRLYSRLSDHLAIYRASSRFPSRTFLASQIESHQGMDAEMHNNTLKMLSYSNHFAYTSY